ncbi:MAG: succinate dehydrogenase, cytochrome b556 subunit [Methylocystaceae bacterium]|nr:succinate dehydrogenase, cytochrome b556 subunit [Methylocystaceae bacterium]
MAKIDLNNFAQKRPLSPHLSVYRPMLTMMMSIAHRITGAALYLGMALLSLFLLGAAMGSVAFSMVSWLGSGFIGTTLVFLITWAIFHHILGGVRHAFWDRGLYMDPKGREFLALGTLIGGVAMTVILWVARALVG